MDGLAQDFEIHSWTVLQYGCVARHEQNLTGRKSVLEFGAEFVPIHFGHHHIANYQIGVLFGGSVQGILPIVKSPSRYTTALKNHGECVSDYGLVINDKHRHWKTPPDPLPESSQAYHGCAKWHITRSASVELADLKGRGKTVLVAEDEECLRKAITQCLSEHGYLVLEAANGKQALELADQSATRIDLLLTDIIMPGMSGRELDRCCERNGQRAPDHLHVRLHR